MTQTRRGSMAEAVVNVALGYGVAVAANVVVLPAYGFPVSWREAGSIGLVFTAVSLARSYLVRRAFNARGER